MCSGMMQRLHSPKKLTPEAVAAYFVNRLRDGGGPKAAEAFQLAMETREKLDDNVLELCARAGQPLLCKLQLTFLSAQPFQGSEGAQCLYHEHVFNHRHGNRADKRS